MESKEIEINERMIFDFFHIAALRFIADVKWDKLTIIGGRTPRVYAVYDSNKKIPELSEFKLTHNGKEINLQDFSIRFKDIKIQLQNIAAEYAERGKNNSERSIKKPEKCN